MDHRGNPPTMSDLALELFRHGYTALPRLWDAEPEATDYLRHRMLGRTAHVVRGEEGARLFYDESVVQREGAIPAPLRRVLFGKGALHGLDETRHRERKAIFLEVLTPERVESLGDDVARELAESMLGWTARTPFRLFDELVRIYGTCVLPWAGVAVEPGEAATVARRLAEIVDGFGFAPVAYPRACWARWWADRWAARVVREAREGSRHPRPGSMLAALATGSGAALTAETAGVELLNVLRPTVAVAWLGAYAVVDLVRHPQYGRLLAAPAERAARWHFADEVRRTAPFVPALAARVRRPVTFQGHLLDRGDLLVLDVPATNHRSWSDGDRFRPERFAEHTPNAFEHLPQGGGDPRQGHRCPGEGVAMTLLDRTLLHLAAGRFTISTSSPELHRIPTLPGAGVEVTDVQPGDYAVA
jgi:fatty-acid peroxygenase